jgi:2-phospho-L-lactate guanylyltransferase
MIGGDTAKFTAIIPVKPSSLAKSRIDLPAHNRSLLARAFASDVLTAVGSSDLIDAILIITARDDLAEQARRHHAVILRDRPLLARDGLNSAIGIGGHWASSRREKNPVVVVPSDLPCLTSALLDETLRLMRGDGSAFVPDRSGSGTTLLSASTPRLLLPSYGPGSRRRHAQLGATCVDDVVPHARHDVDTLDDLAAALPLGVGQQTQAALSQLGLRADLTGAGASIGSVGSTSHTT